MRRATAPSLYICFNILNVLLLLGLARSWLWRGLEGLDSPGHVQCMVTCATHRAGRGEGEYKVAHRLCIRNVRQRFRHPHEHHAIQNAGETGAVLPGGGVPG